VTSSCMFELVTVLVMNRHGWPWVQVPPGSVPVCSGGCMAYVSVRAVGSGRCVACDGILGTFPLWCRWRPLPTQPPCSPPHAHLCPPSVAAINNNLHFVPSSQPITRISLQPPSMTVSRPKHEPMSLVAATHISVPTIQMTPTMIMHVCSATSTCQLMSLFQRACSIRCSNEAYLPTAPMLYTCSYQFQAMHFIHNHYPSSETKHCPPTPCVSSCYIWPTRLVHSAGWK
jgi:hypothetical protein